MNTAFLKKILFILLFAVIFINLAFRITTYSKEYTTRFDSAYWKQRYLASQWVVSGSKNSIGDDGLYAYAGWEYIHGSDPTLLNAEIPPLAKYMIGLGEVIFQNQDILILLVGILGLFVFYKINTILFKNKVLAIIPVTIFSLEPIFFTQLRAPYLDGIYLLFLMLTILFTLKKKYILSALFLGCFASVKYPVGSLFLLFPMVFWVYLYDKKNLKQFLVSLVIFPLVFLASYSMYFVKGGNILGFLGVQKWIIHFYSTGAKAGVGIVFPLILFGKWFTWFNGLQNVSEWNVLWAVSLIGVVFSFFALLFSYFTLKNKKKKNTLNQPMIFMFFWVVSYLFFLTFTPVFPRYLLLLVPFMYNLTVWFLEKYLFPQFS